MKKIVVSVLATLCLILTGCGSGSEQKVSPEPTNEPAPVKPGSPEAAIAAYKFTPPTDWDNVTKEYPDAAGGDFSVSSLFINRLNGNTLLVAQAPQDTDEPPPELKEKNLKNEAKANGYKAITFLPEQVFVQEAALSFTATVTNDEKKLYVKQVSFKRGNVYYHVRVTTENAASTEKIINKVNSSWEWKK